MTEKAYYLQPGDVTLIKRALDVYEHQLLKNAAYNDAVVGEGSELVKVLRQYASDARKLASLL